MDIVCIDVATHIAEIDQYQVAVCTTDAASEVRVDISSIGIQR